LVVADTPARSELGQPGAGITAEDKSGAALAWGFLPS